jgi:hypothetical protein
MTMNRLTIRNYGSYYDLIASAVLPLYETMNSTGQLADRNCEIWYSGQHAELLQLFSCRPIHTDFLKDPLPKDAVAFAGSRPERTEEWERFRPLAEYIGSQIEPHPEEGCITVIGRRNRSYCEHDDLVKRLAAIGVRVRSVFLEDMAFHDQVNLMRSTRILVGPHGAGLVNMMFMRRGCIIVELMPRGVECLAFPALASACGHKYIEIEAKGGSIGYKDPTSDIRSFLAEKGWPSREDTRNWPTVELQRFVRRVGAFSIDPELIVNVVSRNTEIDTTIL